MGSKKYVYIDISVGSKPVGRIVIELFVDQAVNATDNFKELCTSKAYKETYFYRVIRGFMVQGGNIEVRRSDVIGDYPFEGEKTLSKGGYSIFRSKSNPTGDFSDENLTAIDKSFLVCMANLGKPDTNRSQFFITTDTAKHLNGKHTVLGRVSHGKSVVRSIENTEVYSANTKDENAWIPKNPVVIEDCGEWKEGDEVPVYDCCRATIGGDIYEEYPDDNELPNVNLDNSEQAYDICLKIKKSAGLLYSDKRYLDSFHKYKKAMRYCNELIADEEKEHDMYVKFLDYKKTLYLNLALTSLELQNYQACIDYCGYLFEFVGDNKEVKLTSVQVSKAFFRLGKAYEGLCKYTEALDALRKGLAVNPEDIGIKTETAKVKKLKYDSEREERTRYTKFFN